MFDFNIFITEFEVKKWQNQMQIPKLISSYNFFTNDSKNNFENLVYAPHFWENIILNETIRVPNIS